MTSGSAINDHGVLTQKVDSQMLPDDVKELQAECNRQRQVSRPSTCRAHLLVGVLAHETLRPELPASTFSPICIDLSSICSFSDHQRADAGAD